MSNLNSKKGFKALAIGCAVLLTCATAQMFANSSTGVITNSAIVSAENFTYTSEINSDGCLILHIDTTTDTTVSLSLSGGVAGATTSGEVGYWDGSASKWVGGYSNWEEQKFDDSGNLTITGIKVPANTKDVQVMVTYYADWSSGKEVKCNLNALKINSISSGSSSSSSSSNSSNSGSNNNNSSSSSSNGGSTTASMPSNAQCGWTDITEGTSNTNSKNLTSSSVSGSTKTVTLNQSGQWSAYDEGNEPIILDQTWEPETEGVYDTDRGNDTITNSNNFMFNEDLNVPTTASINHFRFTIESDEPMIQVQFGAGISVQKGSEIANSGSTSLSDGVTTDNIWFNESGTFDPENEDDYASLENSNGKKYYGFNRGKDVGETNYLQLQWDVYDDVKPYIQNDIYSSVSVQYWYGVDPADWDKIDWENVTGPQTIDSKPTQVTVTEATCNYDVTESYQYSDTATKSVSLESYGDMAGVKFSDLGLTENDKPKAVTFTVSGASDIGKLVGSFGVSVNDECPTDSLTSANWYQSDNIVYEDCGSTYEITWVIPSNIANYISPEYDAEVKFGAWYAGSGENELSSLKITNVSVDYYTEEAVTTTPATTTTAVTTTPTVIDGAIKGEVVDYDSAHKNPIDPADEDNHSFRIEPITDILPEAYNPTTDDIAQIIFNISSDTDMSNIKAGFGIAVSNDCPDATDDYWYQADDFDVSGTGKNVTITYTVPESIRSYIQENQYGALELGIWYAGEGVSNVYLDNVQVVYTSQAEVTTTTPATTTTATTTTTPAVTTTPATTTTTEKTTTTTTEVTTTTSTASDNVWGDANCDGEVMANDLLLLKKHTLGISELSGQGLDNCDVTHDGDVLANDLAKLKKFILGIYAQDKLASSGL